MSETGADWLKGCVLGCGAVVVVGVLLIVGMSISLRSAFDAAHEDRERLEARFGDGPGYVPAADGSVAADRVEAFLAVRSALADVHAEIEAVDREAASFEDLADEGEPPLRVALPAVARLSKSMIGLPWVFGELERTRNRALVEVGMGIDEYTYLYVMAYHRQLVEPPDQEGLFTGSAVNRRVLDDLRAALEAQLEAATAAAADPEWVAALTAEIETMSRKPERLPWQDGLPEATAGAFEPYRQRLDAVFSASAAELELLNSTVKGGGLRIDMK